MITAMYHQPLITRLPGETFTQFTARQQAAQVQAKRDQADALAARKAMAALARRRPQTYTSDHDHGMNF